MCRKAFNKQNAEKVLNACRLQSKELEELEIPQEYLVSAFFLSHARNFFSKMKHHPGLSGNHNVTVHMRLTAIVSFLKVKTTVQKRFKTMDK